jgi:hypothetical protein
MNTDDRKPINIAIIGGASGGRSLATKALIEYAKSHEHIHIHHLEPSSKKLKGATYTNIWYDELAIYTPANNLIAFDDLPSASSLSEPLKEIAQPNNVDLNHVGRGDPNGLRQQFNRRGKKWRK